MPRTATTTSTKSTGATSDPNCICLVKGIGVSIQIYVKIERERPFCLQQGEPPLRCCTALPARTDLLPGPPRRALRAGLPHVPQRPTQPLPYLRQKDPQGNTVPLPQICRLLRPAPQTEGTAVGGGLGQFDQEAQGNRQRLDLQLHCQNCLPQAAENSRNDQ